MAFGKDLRNMRRYKGYKLKEFANMVGLDYAYLSELEREKAIAPGIEKLVQIADALGIDRDTTILKAGRIPLWIKELFLTDRAMTCAIVLKEVASEEYNRRTMWVGDKNSFRP